MILLLAITACHSKPSSFERVILQADSLMDANQDSAKASQTMLDKIKPQYAQMKKAEQMHYQLTYAKAMNKAFVNFTTDSVMKQVVSYYEQKGSSNEKMLAYYLLGCAYRDLNKKPSCLSNYIKAIESADTTHKKCDFNLLARIYGQVGTIYHDTQMPSDALDAFKHCKKYADLSNDTLLALQAITYQANAYEDLGDTTTFLRFKKEVFHQYIKLGQTRNAALALCSTIGTYVNMGKLDKAKQYMVQYATSAGLTEDKDGRIGQGKEIYHLTKGNYFMKTNQLDSAEVQYERLLHHTQEADEKEDAYRALSALYQQLGIKDSIAKYASLALIESDNNYRKTPIKALAEQQALYDSERAEHKAFLLAEENKWSRFRWITSILFIGIAFGFIFYYYRQRNAKRMLLLQLKYERNHRIVNLYLQNIKSLEAEKKLLEETSLSDLKKNEEAKVQMKIKIEKLKEQIKQFEALETGVQVYEIQEQLRNIKIKKLLDKKAAKGEIISEEELQNLKDEVNKLAPRFFMVFNPEKLNENELMVCLLTKIYIRPKEIQNLLGLVQGHVSTLKKRAGKKIFGIDMSTKEVDDKIHSIL